jgi:hypothetical protein
VTPLDPAAFQALAAQWKDGWEASVRKTFGDRWTLLETKSAEFEQLDLDDPVRRAGYPTYAPASLPQSKGKPKWPAKWGDWKSIKKGLLAMSRNKCPYCESQAGADQWGQVEHFRPKSLFPTRAYDWGNYLYSCEKCNGTKSNKWPAAGSYLRPDEAGFDPSVLTFGDDGSVTGAAGDAARTVEDLGLDREGVRKARGTIIGAALKAVNGLINDNDLPKARKRKHVRNNLAEADFPYSEAVNQAIRRAWLAAFPGDPL